MHQLHFTDTQSRRRYETMTKSPAELVSIKPTPEQQRLSKGQKQFNSLVKQIDELKKQLLEWQDFVPSYHQQVSGKYEVLWENYSHVRLELVRLFDTAYAQKSFKKQEKEKLKDAILTIVSKLLADDPSDERSDELKALHDKYSDISFDMQDQEMGDVMKSMMEAMLGEELGEDVDVSSPEKLHAFMAEKLAAQQAQAEQQQREMDERSSKRKKTAKQLQREEQQKTEELNLQKSIQDIYRKLVGALHPDREPDSVERERKTELMRQLNVAYEKKDLLKMLELQLATEKVDQARINTISEDRLKHYNKVLKEQIEKLREEIDHAEMPFRMRLRLSPWDPLTPKKVMSRLKADIKSLKAAVEGISSDLQAFKNPGMLKVWLQNYQIREPDMSDFEDFLQDEFTY